MYRRALAATALVVAATGATSSPATAAERTMEFVGAKPVSVTALDETGRSALVTAKVVCPEGATGFIKASVASAYDGGLLGKYLTYVRCTGEVQKLSVQVDVPDYGPSYPYAQELVTPGATLRYGVSIPLFVDAVTSPTSGRHIGVLSHTGETKVKRPA